MAEAVIELNDGGVVRVTGNPDEVAHVLRLVGLGQTPRGPSKHEVTKGGAQEGRKREGATELVLQLKDEGFFDRQRTLAEVQEALRGQGRIYPVTSLSPLMIRLVRQKRLGRLRDSERRWTYVTR